MPVTHGFKTPGILRAGFYYQDLIGIDVLLRMFRDPSLYAWVSLEADDSQFQAIEDVVACRADGLFDLTQVKFTPDPSQAGVELSWQWLLHRKTPRSTSLIQKWATTTNRHALAGQLASARLRTDRRPDAGFAACLQGDRVDYDRVPPATRQTIEAQVGGEAPARLFFDRFAFSHSEDQLADLEHQLKSRVVPADTDDTGWLKFTAAVWRWATLKDHPRPGGQITRADLTQYITRQASKPIPQDFRIPDGYEVPNTTFHKAFLKVVTGSDGITVLWGAPGRGKSTYLSYCGDQRAKAEGWVRHHYFLSTTDTTTARFYFHEIARSLVTQIRAAVPEVVAADSDLQGAIAAAGAILGAKGSRLVLVIDGLDHVWRERRSLEQMAQLFNSILPLPPFVHLVVGTQKVPDEQLPSRLLEMLPKDQWTELPLMSEDSVRSWLTAQGKAGRLLVADDPRESKAATFSALVAAFHESSRGLPLHLIYSFEALIRRGGAISRDHVLALPACPDGDIRTYYRALWTRIDARAREVLHILAGIEFAMPNGALWELFGRSPNEAKAIEQIDHLLERRLIGILPFHGSIFAFVREIADHAAVFRAHGPRVVEWLRNEAPPYWRWAWLWITQARLGAPEDLFNLPTRAWAIESMASGYGLDQIKLILEHAEEIAFERMALPRLIELRSLHSRLANAPEFQMSDMSGFTEVASALSSDDYPRLHLRDELVSLEPKLMLTVLRAMTGKERADAARAALNELDRRIQRQVPEEHFRSNQKDWRRELVRTAAFAEDVRINRVINYARQFTDEDELMAGYARECLRAGKASEVIAAGKLFSGHEFDRELAAALALEGIAAGAAGLPKVRGRAPLIRAWCALKGVQFGVNPRHLDLKKVLGPADRYESHHNGTRSAVREVFLIALGLALEAPGPGLTVTWPKEIEGSWLQEMFQDLIALASAMAGAWRDHAVAPSMGALYAGIEVKRPYSRDYGDAREFIAARLGMVDLAIDLQTLAIGLDPADRIDASDIAAASKSSWWLDELWLEAFGDRRLPLHNAAGAEAFTQRIRRHLDVTVIDFSERAQTSTKVCQFANDNGLTAIAREELTRAADCALGYGWRKDPYAFELLGAFEHLIGVGSAAPSQMILEVAAAFEAITDYTDGDETNHARSEYYALLARIFPDRGVACYRALLEAEEWRYADELLRDFVEHLPDDDGRTGLLRTFIHASEFDTVSRLAEEGRDAGVLPYLNTVNGQRPSTRRRKRERASSPDPLHGRRRRSIDITQYSVSEFPALVKKLRKRRGFGSEGDTFDAWLRHWDEQGAGNDALEALARHIEGEQTLSLLDKTLDLAFEISLRVQGRSKAFEWAVLAHRHRYGWQRWYTSQSESQARLIRVAKEFPSRWREYIELTSIPVWTEPGERGLRVIGLDRLVFFLVQLGEMNAAEAYTRAMVDVLLAEVSNQPLKTPAWAV